MQKDGEQKVDSFRVPNETADRIKREIDKLNTNEKVFIDKLYDLTGFKKNDQIMAVVYSVFNNVDVNVNGLQDVIALKEKKSLTDVEAHVSAQAKFNLGADLEKVIGMFTQNSSMIMNGLFPFTFKKAGISVGPAELCVAMFSNTTKGKIGDLYAEGIGQFELKTEIVKGGGRVGTGDYTEIFKLPEKINTFLKTKNQTLDPRIVETRGKIIKAIASVRKKIQERQVESWANQSGALKKMNNALEHIEKGIRDLKGLDTQEAMNVYNELKSVS